MNTASDLLTTREVAVILRLSSRTVRRAVRRGDLAAVRVGRTVRVARSELVAFRNSELASATK